MYIILFENELKMGKFDLKFSNETHGGRCPYQGIIQKMTS
jgi:hypothetical protein